MKQKLRYLFFVFLLSAGYLQAQTGYIGEIRMFGGNFAPRGWAFCEGQLLPISSNTALFSIIGTTYGGDGRTTFALPDLRGRVAVNVGTGTNLSPVAAGQKMGVETNTLNVNQIPAHTHPFYGVGEDGNSASPSNAFFAGTKVLDPEYANSGTQVPLNAQVLGTNSTTNQPVENRQPSLATAYIICIQGIFPSRS